MNCRKCGSENVEIVSYQGTDCIVCHECGYDEREEFEVFLEERKNSGKGRYSPYKTGGPRRGQK